MRPFFLLRGKGVFLNGSIVETMMSDFNFKKKIIDFSDLEPYPFNESYVTLGNFDGIHLGHQAIIHQLVEKARSGSHPVVVITFYPNPTVFFKQLKQPYYLTSPAEKEAKLLGLGVNTVITFQFDHNFSGLSPREFLSGIKQNLGMEVLVVGQDFALGKDRVGTISVIEEIGRDLSFSVETIQPVIRNGEEISSTQIRQCLDQGEVHRAAEMLGRPYVVSGVVSHGSDRGSRIGLPTANITFWEEKKLPAVGVYATKVTLGDREYQSVTNVGYRPTFEIEKIVNIETHILDFDGNIYGEPMQVAFIQKIRDEKKFSGIETLLEQIELDKLTAREIFRNDQT